MDIEDPEFEAFVEAQIYPTEDSYKVLACLSNIFPEAEWYIEEEVVKGYTTSLNKFAEILQTQKIRDTAKEYLMKRSSENHCEFFLSKQASCSSRVNFFDEGQPLGGIKVKLTSPSITKVIEDLTNKGGDK